ncbi:uncharacterized protein KY384_007729 [Bacidia gigantensis]|uniref:uncharacterized protein n=1 Tax=Bacidia gigantensis TaxID=2732470 RepID=UPI001D044873|nr:uncharacterized protein KY384_007729 [Bacidia gigantensis]KAG8527576.1 hypothetical protein KY384_007729 [Bacidia gigantensis]
MTLDLEKQAAQVEESTASSTSDKEGVIVARETATPSAPHVPVPSKLRALNNRIENLAGLEARGITRVLPEERHGISPMRYAQMAIIWYSANISANNLAVGLLGPLLFNLGFVDSAMMAVWGCLLGSAVTAYMSTWGAQSGNRTMIVVRYFMGYWPAKLTTVLNMILMVGYAVISTIISGQILSAVSDGSMSIVVGIVITALISWLVAVFGMSIFHTYERYAWIPQTIVLLILCGVAGKNFNTGSVSIIPDGAPSAAITADRLSFFSLQLSVPLSWAGAGSDFYVYYPESTSKRLTFLMTLTGLWISFIFVNLIGIGLGAGTFTNTKWNDAYGISSGALILEGFAPLHGFGKFCGVVVALGVISNNVPGTYAAALNCQVLGRFGKMVPRWLWVCVIVLIYFVCAIAGRDHLFAIFQNFLALMGYWLVILVTIVVEETLIFRRSRGFDWTKWEDQKYLPVGAAALLSFLIGWAGAIIGMYQVWYVGPVAQQAGDGYGADIGIWLALGFTLVVFPPLRFLELKTIGR